MYRRYDINPVQRIDSLVMEISAIKSDFEKIHLISSWYKEFANESETMDVWLH